MRCETPAMACSSSPNRSGPVRRVPITSRLHLSPIRSSTSRTAPPSRIRSGPAVLGVTSAIRQAPLLDAYIDVPFVAAPVRTDHHATHSATGWGNTVNIALWIVQGLLALGSLAAGGLKSVRPREQLVASGNFDWMRDSSAAGVKGVGLVEILGALGLILPWLTG